MAGAREGSGTFLNPLVERYASSEMVENFASLRRFRLWRKLWLALAEAEQELGIEITDEQLAEMRAHLDDVNIERAEALERETRHEVVAHIRAFGEQCPGARPIIHLGATSCFVTDNADLIIMRDGLMLILSKLVNVVEALASFARAYVDVPTLGYTHLQTAQPTTVGKRACLWLQDLLFDLVALERGAGDLKLRGAKGATGTQASFLALFRGDGSKVVDLERRIALKMGFEETYPVTGQTYSRKVDSAVVNVLSGIAESAHKFANDVRFLQSRGELFEPFEEKQVGSSAMPFKQNPMRCERMSGLARLLISFAMNPAVTAASQWLERTLDDSSNRRIVVPEAFLAADGVLRIYLNVASGLRVERRVVESSLRNEMPFLSVERILVEAVRAGGDRQELHEKLRDMAMASREVMAGGGPNDFAERIARDPAFKAVKDKLPQYMDTRLAVGRAPEQVREFVEDCIDPILRRYASLLGMSAALEV